MNVISDSKAFRRLIVFFFAFGLVFPTLRVLLIGNATSANFFQYFLSSLPELIVFVLTIYTALRLFRSENRIQFKTMDWMVLGFMVSNVVLGFLLAQNIKLSFYGFRMTYLPMLFYFLVRCYNFKEDELKRTLQSVFLLMVMLSVAGCILYFFMPGVMIDMILKSGGEVGEYFIMRMTSILWTPVVFATFTIAGFLYFFYRSLSNEHWSNYLLMAILWTGTTLAISRGAVIALLFGLLFFSFFFFKPKIVIKTFLLMTGIMLLCSTLFPDPLKFFQWFWGSSLDTVMLKRGITRVELWRRSFEHLNEYPFGHGLGMTGHVATRFMSADAQGADIYSTDGWFLKLLNETGIWGMLSYITLATTFVLAVWKRVLKNKNLLLGFLLVYFVVFNVQNVVSNVLDFYLFSYLFWLLMGIAVNQYYKNATLEP